MSAPVSSTSAPVVRIPRRKPRTARIGLFGVGYHVYWGQFPGLLNELLAKLAVLEGAPREALPQAARDYKASLVVMGAMSRSGMQRLLVGNTAEAVLDHLTCDVLVMKPGKFQSKVPRRTRGAQLMALPSAMTG